MKAVIIILIVLLVLFLLYILCLRCRRGKADWAHFRKWRYAHRGFHDREKGVPENSLAAFKRAASNGFGAELDVHLMKDGRLAVIHDASLLRTAGADVYIEGLTAGELESYRRGNAAALAAATCAVLDKYKVDCCVESFDPRCLMWLWQNRPDVIRGQLSENFTAHGDAQHLPGGVRWILSNLLLNVRTRPDFIAYRFSDRDNLSLRLCRSLYGVQEASWTIRSKADMDAAEAAGSLVIFENFDPRG